MTGPSRHIRVWDLPTRLFHWSLAASVAVAAAVALFGRESWLDLHLWAGYAVALLLLWRLVWGFFGAPASRFAAFAFGPRAVLAHLRAAMAAKPSPHLGHPPLGAMMVFALLAILAAIVATGFVALGGQEKQGPLAALTGFAAGHSAKEIHEALAYLILALVGLHVAGVLAESWLARDSLVRAMITGCRRAAPGHHPLPAGRSRPLAAAVSLTVVAAVAGPAIAALSALPPAGWRPLALPEDYRAACGECHTPHHPSLLPAQSWRLLMAGLADHFGEDASLGEGEARGIAGWLAANAAETWDTEAANRLRLVSAESPLRITAAPFWRRRHDALPDRLFARRSVGSKVNCAACHRDAEGGRFDDQKIDIPEE